MKKRKEILFILVIVVLCVLLFAKRFTGEIWHAVFGVVLTAMAVAHVYLQIGKMKYKKSSVRLLDYMLLAALSVLLLTGILAHPLHGVPAVKILHKLAALIFVPGLFGHALQHREALPFGRRIR